MLVTPYFQMIESPTLTAHRQRQSVARQQQRAVCDALPSLQTGRYSSCLLMPACRAFSPDQLVALVCCGQRLRTALMTRALASVVVGRASDCTRRCTTRRTPRSSMPKPSQTTIPSRNRSSSEAAARSLVPKLIALTSAMKRPGSAVGVDKEVVVASLLLTWSHPAPAKLRRPSRTTCLISQRITGPKLVPPLDTRRFLERQPAK
jgi:hypothetical protein